MESKYEKSSIGMPFDRNLNDIRDISFLLKRQYRESKVEISVVVTYVGLPEMRRKIAQDLNMFRGNRRSRDIKSKTRSPLTVFIYSRN